MSKKIGLFLDTEPTGGGAFQFGQSMLEAVSTLPKDRFEKVVVYTNSKWKPYVHNHGHSHIFVRPGLWRLLAHRRFSGLLPMPLWRRCCLLFHPVAKALLQQKCDLWVFPAQDTWTYLMPVPALGVIFDLMHRYERQYPEVSARGIYHIRERHYKNMCRWSKGLIVDSEVGKRQVLESYRASPEKVHVLPFIPPNYIFEDLPLTLSGCQNLPKKYIFYPAQFWVHKNHLRLIMAAYMLRNKLPDLNLVFAGAPKNGYFRAVELVHKLRLEKNIHFIGYVPDSQMALLYRNARAMIMPTFFGPTNIPPLEAIALGCPVAVSKIYGMPEQLGNAALYFNPGSIDEIARTIELLWLDDNVCRQLAFDGLRRASEWAQPDFNERLREIILTISSLQLN